MSQPARVVSRRFDPLLRVASRADVLALAVVMDAFLERGGATRP
jgi:hypothetical protein